MIKEGDLVRFVGDARFYKGRIGVVCRLYSTHGISLNGVVNNDSALVYYAGAEKAGRSLQPEVKSGLHPMGLDEIEVIDR